MLESIDNFNKKVAAFEDLEQKFLQHKSSTKELEEQANVGLQLKDSIEGIKKDLEVREQ